MAKTQPIVKHKILANPAMFAAVADIYTSLGFTTVNTLQGGKLCKVVLSRKGVQIVLVHRIPS